MAGDSSGWSLVRQSRSRWFDVRGLRYHVREWGREGAPRLVLLHGARDSSASFQFLVDALDGDWHCLAIDWRGHGQTAWANGHYWLVDFAGDLDALWDEIAPQGVAALVGHSMGANVASLFTALRPRLVERLVLLDALGNRLDQSPVIMPDTLIAALDTSRTKHAGGNYTSIEQMAQRLCASNRRLTRDKALFLASAASSPAAQGGFVWSKDPAFKRSLPTLHNAEEWGTCWRRIEGRVLCLFSSDPRENAVTSDPYELDARLAQFRDVEAMVVPDTGHNLHHDAAREIALVIERFVESEDSREDEPSLPRWAREEERLR